MRIHLRRAGRPLIGIARLLTPAVLALVVAGCGGSSGAAANLPTGPTPPPAAAQPTLTLQLRVVPAATSTVQEVVALGPLTPLQFQLEGSVSMTVASAKVVVKCRFATPDDAEIFNGPEVFGPARIVTPGEPWPLLHDMTLGVPDQSLFNSPRPLLCTATASPPPPGAVAFPPLDSALESTVTVPLRPEDANSTIACESSSLRHCWRNRWQTFVNYKDDQGSTVPARVHTAFSDGAAFSFDDPGRQDIFVRLKDECAVSGYYAVGITYQVDRQAEVVFTDAQRDEAVRIYRDSFSGRYLGPRFYEDPQAFPCP